MPLPHREPQVPRTRHNLTNSMRAGSSVGERLSYTQLVRGSNPFSRITFSPSADIGGRTFFGSHHGIQQVSAMGGTVNGTDVETWARDTFTVEDQSGITIPGYEDLLKDIDIF